jgi:hypothetical protein
VTQPQDESPQPRAATSHAMSVTRSSPTC